MPLADDTQDPIELDVGVLDHDGSLSVWRQFMPWASATVTRKVQRVVIDALKVLEREDLVDGVIQCDGIACERAGKLVARSANPDWWPTCLWLSVRLAPEGQRSAYARIALAGALASAADDARRVNEPAEYSRLTAMCAMVMTTALLPSDREGLAALIEGETPRQSPFRPKLGPVSKHLPPKPLPDADGEDQDAEGFAARRLPRRRVLPEGLPEGVAEAARLKTRFPSLLKSMPSTPLPDPDAVEAALTAEMPWMQAAIERVVGDLRVARMLGGRELRIRPLLLVGPPGLGKSRFARRLAALAGAPFGAVAAGGSADNRALAGTASGWAGAQPAYPVMVMATAQRSSAVVLIDELDKAGGGERNGRITDTLLSMTEVETARRWPDECLCAPVDLRGVTWIATANTVEHLPAALLDRFGVVEPDRPGPEAFDVVLGGVLADMGEEFGAGRAAGATLRALIEDDAMTALRAAWAESASPRRLRGLAHAVLASVAKNAGRH